jgi:hypothetical protein
MGRTRDPHYKRDEQIMGRHAASRIGAWRTSGVNRPGYSRPPAPPQPVPQAPQSPADEWDFDADVTVDLGSLRDHSVIRRLAAKATEAKWGPLPSVFVGKPSVRIRVGGVPVVLPGTWELVVGRSSDGIETIYGLDQSGTLHLIMLRGDGEPAEMGDVPPEVLEYLRDLYYPRSTS